MGTSDEEDERAIKMILEEIKEKIREVDFIDEEIRFIDHTLNIGIYTIDLLPLYTDSIEIPPRFEELNRTLGKDVTKILKKRLSDLDKRRTELLAEMGVNE